MRRTTWIAGGLLALGLVAQAARADEIEVKGPHICCKQCIRVAQGLLKDIPGVSGAKADQQAKTVTFTAEKEKAARAGVKALYAGGFFGAATRDGKALKMDVAKGKGKANAVVVEKVHVCCGQCVKAVNKIFEGSKVTIEGKGVQRDVRVEGENLDRGVVLETLRKAGFNGTLAK